MYLQTWNILSWTSVVCLTLSMLGEGQRRRSQLWFRYIRSITDRKSASHSPSWVSERSEKPTAHQQRGLRLKSIIKSHPPLINVSLPSLQTQNDIQRRGFPVRCCVGMMNDEWVQVSYRLDSAILTNQTVFLLKSHVWNTSFNSMLMKLIYWSQMIYAHDKLFTQFGVL